MSRFLASFVLKYLMTKSGVYCVLDEVVSMIFIKLSVFLPFSLKYL